MYGRKTQAWNTPLTHLRSRELDSVKLQRCFNVFLQQRESLKDISHILYTRKLWLITDAFIHPECLLYTDSTGRVTGPLPQHRNIQDLDQIYLAHARFGAK